MNLEKFLAYCLSKPGVTEHYPMKGETVWMKVAGKLFAICNVQTIKMDGDLVEPFHFINLKCDPDQALDLRQAYPAILPAWHQSKVHWNTVLMNGSLEDDMVYGLIDQSYQLVKASLSKKLQASL